MSDDLLVRAIELARAGRKNEALPLLQQVLTQNPANELGWLWLADCLPGRQARIQALETCLKFVPEAKRARAGLAALYRQVEEGRPAIAERGNLMPVDAPVATGSASQDKAPQDPAASTPPETGDLIPYSDDFTLDLETPLQEIEETPYDIPPTSLPPVDTRSFKPQSPAEPAPALDPEEGQDSSITFEEVLQRAEEGVSKPDELPQENTTVSELGPTAKIHPGPPDRSPGRLSTASLVVLVFVLFLGILGIAAVITGLYLTGGGF